MTEGEENIIIKGVLLEAISRDFSEELSNNKEVSVSPRFKRQMMAMMNNPNKWAERHKRDYRRRFVKVVATIVLTCSLPFGVLTVASPTVRAAVIDWVVEWYESSIIYKFFGESDSTKLPLYEVIDLPFDYTRIGIPQELPNNTEIIYENSDGEILRFEYMRVEEGSAIIIHRCQRFIPELLLGRILWEMIRWKQMRSTSIIISRRKDSPRMLSVGFLEI